MARDGSKAFLLGLIELILIVAFVAMPLPETQGMKQAVAAYAREPSSVNYQGITGQRRIAETERNRARCAVVLTMVMVFAVYLFLSYRQKSLAARQ